MNPELRRNLWLEITLHRLLGMPIVLGLAFFAVAAVDSPKSMERLAWLALAGFALLTVLWGTRLAASCVLDELGAKTWDWQRLSVIRPWTMAWGKLFGATAFVWYGGLICLAVFLTTASATSIGSPYKLTLTLLLLAVVLHAATLASTLHVARKAPDGRVPKRRSMIVLVVLVAGNLLPWIFFKSARQEGQVVWYGNVLDIQDFALASTAAFAGWAMVGAYRSMCQSLAVRTTPAVWVGFLAFLTLYSAGFAIGVLDTPVPTLQKILVAGLICSVALTYLMLFTESSSPIVIRRVLQKARERRWRRVFEEIPCWAPTWIYAASCALGLAATGMGFLVAGDSIGFSKWPGAPIPLVLLIARDAGLVLYFSAAAKPERATGTALVYLLVLYWILPWLLFASGQSWLAQLVLPLGGDDHWMQLASAFLQAGVVATLVFRRVSANFAAYRRADG